MKIGWGWKIAILYVGFVLLIVTLVTGSIKQHFDLVSEDYYGDEIAYQKVIDGGKNQAGLSAPMAIHADGQNVVIELPSDFKDKAISGNIHFYSPVNAALDKTFPLVAEQNTITISRNTLSNTNYVLKINLVSGGKSYYQESALNLHS